MLAKVVFDEVLLCACRKTREKYLAGKNCDGIRSSPVTRDALRY